LTTLIPKQRGQTLDVAGLACAINALEADE